MKKILAFGAHPDDVELGCGGTLALHARAGDHVVICDLTRGELGTRGTPEIRHQEATRAAQILGVRKRHNLDLADGFFADDRDTRLRIIQAIRTHQPDIVLAPSIADRHPDHGRAADLIRTCGYLAGLAKIDTPGLAAWRPRTTYFYIQDRLVTPNFAIDISATFETKMAAIQAFQSQFFDPESQEPQTPISSQAFLDHVQFRAASFGRLLGVDHAEGFVAERLVGVRNLGDLL